MLCCEKLKLCAEVLEDEISCVEKEVRELGGIRRESEEVI